MAESIKQRAGAIANNKDAVQFRKLLDAARTELVALRALANELRTDHATMKTSHDVVVTLIDELHDDHATTKTVLDDLKAKYEDHRHSVAGAAATGTAPSTAAAAAEATASTVTQSLATLTAAKPAAGPATLTAAATTETLTE